MDMSAIVAQRRALHRMKGPFMSLPSLSRISRRSFAAGALGVAAAALTASKSLAQATPAAQASPVASTETPVVRIEFVGGFRPLEYYILQTPSLLVYSDGTVIQPAPVIAIYPPAAITPFNTFTISEAAVSNLIDRAIAAGLDEPQELIRDDVMDATTATITVAVDGNVMTSSVYALDINGPKPESWDSETMNLYVGIQEFASFARNLATSLDTEDIVAPETPYVPTRLEVIAFEPDAAEPLSSGIPDLTAPPLIWPLDDSLGEIGAVYDRVTGYGLPETRCAEISGSDAAEVIAVAETGNLVSPWQDGETTYGVFINPLFPGESSCRNYPL
jgi:hypothetical protein